MYAIKIGAVQSFIRFVQKKDRGCPYIITWPSVRSQGKSYNETACWLFIKIYIKILVKQFRSQKGQNPPAALSDLLLLLVLYLFRFWSICTGWSWPISTLQRTCGTIRTVYCIIIVIVLGSAWALPLFIYPLNWPLYLRGWIQIEKFSIFLGQA